MGRSRTRLSKEPDRKEEANLPSRSAYVVKYASGFERSLNHLGVPERLEVLADLEQFMAEWKRGVSDQELHQGTWNFKDIQGKEAKKCKVKQIRLGPSRQYRVALTPVHLGSPCVWLLEVYHRSDSDRAIPRAVARAYSIWEQVG